MKNLFNKIYLFVLFLFFSLNGQAQLYPIQLTPVFNIPYAVKISDYATSMDPKIQLLVNPTDISINNRQVRLKLYIQGNGLNIQSSDYIQGQRPLFINGGELQTLTNTDIAALFRLENLQGISASQYASPLPDGLYNFCFEMYDFITNQKLSQKSCAIQYLQLNDPPVLNIPVKSEQIIATDFPNILFTWTPRQINATNVSYHFELKQLVDPTLDPQFGFQISPILYEETLFGTSLLYNLSMPILTPGMRYAWRVKAISSSGLSENAVFKNDGYSEIFHFKYSSNCTAPTFLLSQAQGAKSAKITWQSQANSRKFHMQYRTKSIANAQWFSVYTQNNQVTLADLEPELSYEFRVGATCEEPQFGVEQSFVYSTIQEFKMPGQNNTEPLYNCGITPKISIKNQAPISNLIATETFTAGDFPVKILELKGENPYSGTGYIIVPYLADTKLAVTFDNITINTDYQLISGIVETSYNPDWKNVEDVEDFTGEGQGGQIEKEIPFEIASVTKDANGDIVVNGTNGEQIKIPGGKDTVIIGKEGEKGEPGKVFTVDSDGTISAPSSMAEGGKSTPENTAGVDKNGQTNAFTAKGIRIQFSDNEGKYAFDVMPENAPTDVRKLYAKVGSTPLPYKAVLNGDTDTLLATVSLTDANVKLDSIVFKTQNGALIESRKNGNSFILTVKGNQTYAEEQVLATIKQGDKWKVIGAFMLVHLSPKEVNVVLVKLNKAPIAVNSTLDLEKNYKTAGVKFKISPTVLNLEYKHPNATSVAVGDSDFLASYTSDEQSINNYIKKLPDYKTNTYYLIYSDLPASKAEVKGFMALKGQFGYVFPDAPFNTAAHELGHGALGLEHPFKIEAEQGKTNFLMDYGNANASVLWHNDWKQINDPKFRLYLFQGDSEGEQIATTYNYILPNFQPFKFNDADGKKIEDVLNVNSKNNGGFPNGTLYGFTINNIDYVYKTATQNFEPEYINNYNTTDSKKSFRLIIQSETNSCNYYLVEKKIDDLNAKLDLNTLNTQPTVVCDKDGKIPLNQGVNGINMLLAQIKNCGALTSIIFSDEDAKKYLSAEDRYNLIKCVLKGTVANKEENLIIRILQTAPKEQSVDLLNFVTKDETGLLKSIQKRFQLGNYREIYKLLTKIYYEGSNPISIKNEIDAIKNLYNDKTKNGTVKIAYSDLPSIKSVVWLNKGFLEHLIDFDLNSIHFLNDEATINDKGEISFETEWTNLLLSGGTAKYVNIKPFSILRFELSSDEPNLSNAKKGDEVYAPAFMMPFLVNEKFNKEAADAVNVGIIIGTAGSGVLGEGTTASAVATFDIAFSTTALTVDSYKNQIGTTQTGKVFLEGWEVFNKAFLGYIALKMSVAVFEVSVNTFKTSWQTYKNSEGFINFKSLNPSASTRFENEMGTLLKEAEKVVDVGTYTTKIKWGIFDVLARPFEKGYWGKRIAQSDVRVDTYELKINPNNESFYIQNSEGSFVQFENLVNKTLQDGKLVMNKSSIYHVLDKPEFLRTEAILKPAQRQVNVANEAGYKVEWLVSDQKAVDQLTEYFKNNNIDILVKLLPE
jgi:hypothetical protein